MDVSLDYHVSETNISPMDINLANIDLPAETQGERRFVRLHRQGFLALVKVLPPHLLSTLVTLGSYMNEKRTSFTSSRQLSQILGISKEASRERLKALASISYAGVPLITVTSTRRSVMAPLHYKVKFSAVVPLSSGGAHVTDELWIKHFDEARGLVGQLSPEAHVTLLALAVDMTETRTLRVPFQALAKRLGIVPSTAQERIAELCKAGVIVKLSSPSGNEYQIGDDVPLMFGAEEDPENWDLQPVEIELVDVSTIGRLTDSAPHIKKNKRIKEEKTTTPAEITNNSSESKESVVVNFLIAEIKTESDSKRASENTCELPTQEENHYQGKGTLPFAAQVGNKNARVWVDRFGLERCQQVWERAQTATNPGGYMRRALEENWMWVDAEKRATPGGARFHLVDHSKNWGAIRAGLEPDTETDQVGPARDPKWLANVRTLLRSGGVR